MKNKSIGIKGIWNFNEIQTFLAIHMTLLHHGDGFAEGYGGLLGIVPPALRITFGTQHLGTLNWSKLWGKQNQTLDSNNNANLFIYFLQEQINKYFNISCFFPLVTSVA